MSILTGGDILTEKRKKSLRERLAEIAKGDQPAEIRDAKKEAVAALSAKLAQEAEQAIAGAVADIERRYEQRMGALEAKSREQGTPITDRPGFAEALDATAGDYTVTRDMNGDIAQLVGPLWRINVLSRDWNGDIQKMRVARAR